MWAAYAPIAEAVDQRSVVENIRDRMAVRAWDYVLEGNRLGSEYSPAQLEELSTQFDAGVDLCEQYLDGHASIIMLCRDLCGLRLHSYALEVADYSPNPAELYQKINMWRLIYASIARSRNVTYNN